MRFSIKIVVTGIVIILGIISGIIIGYQSVGRGAPDAIASNLPGDFGVPDDMKLSFGVGDSFPLLKVETFEGKSITISGNLMGIKTAIIITALECDVCDEFMNQWDYFVTRKLKKNTQEIILVSYDSLSAPDKLPDYFKKRKVYRIDRNEFESNYNAMSFPIALALNENGTVVAVHYGKQRGIYDELLRFLTTHKI